MIQFTTKVTDGGGELRVSIPRAFEVAAAVLLEQSNKKHGGYLNAKFDLPRRPRTIGPRSQNNRFYGHCEDLAEQVLDENGKAIYSKQQIHDAMLRMSVTEGEGYPTYLDLNGVESPLPSAQATVENMKIVTRTLQRFADIHGFWLHEYKAKEPHKGLVYKSIGGRSYEEMMLLKEE